MLNKGERYDPVIDNGSSQDGICHINRYLFAKDFITPKDSVLDLACGSGYGTSILASAAKHAYGVDISASAIAYAKRYNLNDNTSFQKSDLFSNRISADVVVSFETIEHIPDDFNLIVDCLIGCAKRILIGSVPYRENEGQNPHHFIFNIDESWFDELKIEYDMKFLYQTSKGMINDKMISEDIQNLIFVLDKSSMFI